MSSPAQARPDAVLEAQRARMRVDKGERNTLNLESASSKPSPSCACSSATVSTSPTEEDIAELAYALWQQRGCPEGSSDSDWLRAETILFGEPIAQEEP